MVQLFIEYHRQHHGSVDTTCPQHVRDIWCIPALFEFDCSRCRCGSDCSEQIDSLLCCSVVGRRPANTPTDINCSLCLETALTQLVARTELVPLTHDEQQSRVFESAYARSLHSRAAAPQDGHSPQQVGDFLTVELGSYCAHLSFERCQQRHFRAATEFRQRPKQLQQAQ